MNVLIVLFIISLAVSVIGFLLSRRCMHTWQNVDEMSCGKYKSYVQRCSKCGNLRIKKLKVR
jgi:hypothetical protein